MASMTLDRLQRVLRKPPSVVARRLLMEVNRSVDRYLLRLWPAEISPRGLLRATASRSIDELWRRLASRAYATHIPCAIAGYDDLYPGGEARILAAAEKATSHYVNLLGSRDVYLGQRIDWQRDYKTGLAWPAIYAADIDYLNPGQPSDVKFPWELSRLQWLMPAGQAYCLTGDDHYAAAVRGIIEDWMTNNPGKIGVNWACTMEVALRIVSWTWFFHVFHNSAAWRDGAFRARFLCCLYSHAQFTQQYLEYSDVNGNHCTADAAGLVFAGLFFGEGRAARRWHRNGWRILCDEIEKQVFADGVDFEASTGYHRLVLELFFLPARYRDALGLEVPPSYRERVTAMARFVCAYSRPDGTTPLWGDADDGRALPFGGQPINDHRYLVESVATAWQVDDLMDERQPPSEENFWINGAASPPRATSGSPRSQSFPDGGFYVMRNERDHVFIDCGPVGLAGRGGHGHNDCLSFEAVLDGAHLINDCGSYVYTASYAERNKFRATASHNSPQIDDQEINRLVAEDNLWQLRDDAQPDCQLWRPSLDFDAFRGSHTGYQRLSSPVTPERTILLDHARHALIICDDIRGDGAHRICIPLHLAPGISVERRGEQSVILHSRDRHFVLSWHSQNHWDFGVEDCHVSPSYGVREPAKRLVWRCHGPLDRQLIVCLAPSEHSQIDWQTWASDRLAEIASRTTRRGI